MINRQEQDELRDRMRDKYGLAKPDRSAEAAVKPPRAIVMDGFLLKRGKVGGAAGGPLFTTLTIPSSPSYLLLLPSLLVWPWMFCPHVSWTDQHGL